MKATRTRLAKGDRGEIRRTEPSKLCMSPNLPPLPAQTPRALLIGHRWPEPRSTAAGVRTGNVLEILRDEGWETHFATAAPNRSERAELPAGVSGHAIALNDSALDPWLRALAPEIVVFDRFYSEEQFGWRARQALPEALLVLDTVDLHFLRLARAQGQPADPTAPAAQRELASILRCDLSWVVSDHEHALLTRDLGLPAGLIDISRILYPPSPAPAPWAAREGFATIGTFQHEPNRDAIRWLKRELWPRIRKLRPGASVRVCGSYVTREFSDMHSPREGFLVNGEVESATAELARARVSLAPLRFGAGIKGKILDSWWSGTPVVTTPIGAEGMHAPGEPFAGRVAETADDLAAHAVALLDDEAAAQTLSDAGRAVLVARHGYANERARVGRDLRERLRLLEASRRRHWLGPLLHSQTLRSTEYFSRWIEQKNLQKPEQREAHRDPGAALEVRVAALEDLAPADVVQLREESPASPA